jgi:hypothetical protein
MNSKDLPTMKEEYSNPIAEIAIEELGERSAICNDDARLLALGKKPQLKRVHSFWSCMYYLASKH